MNVIVDTSIFIHANYHVLSKFKEVSEVDLSNAVNNQVTNIVGDLYNRYNINKAFLAIDKYKSFRYNLMGAYKKGRNNINLDMSKVREGINCFDKISFEALEADDICYLLSRKLSPSIIVSEDRDMYQMVDDNTSIYRYKKCELITVDDIDPRYEAINKVFLGCASDNVPRLLPKGWGDKKLRKLYELCDGSLVYMLRDFKESYGIEINHDDVLMNGKLAVYDVNTYLGQGINIYDFYNEVRTMAGV